MTDLIYLVGTHQTFKKSICKTLYSSQLQRRAAKGIGLLLQLSQYFAQIRWACSRQTLKDFKSQRKGNTLLQPMHIYLEVSHAEFSETCLPRNWFYLPGVSLEYYGLIFPNPWLLPKVVFWVMSPNAYSLFDWIRDWDVGTPFLQDRSRASSMMSFPWEPLTLSAASHIATLVTAQQMLSSPKLVLVCLTGWRWGEGIIKIWGLVSMTEIAFNYCKL